LLSLKKIIFTNYEATAGHKADTKISYRNQEKTCFLKLCVKEVYLANMSQLQIFSPQHTEIKGH